MTLEGKKGIIFGVADSHSNAWQIAQAANAAGARLCLTYQDRFQRHVTKLAQDLNDPVLLPCDVTDESQVETVYSSLADEFGTLDFVLHSVAFAGREDLEGSFLKTNWDGFSLAMHISAYSLLTVTRHAVPLMTDGGSILALTYLGSERVVPNYHVMGVCKAALESIVRYLAAELGPQAVRVNALSLGPIRTLAARGIGGFSGMLEHHREKAPMRRGIEGEEVGESGLFLIGNGSSGITGEVIYVDCGYHILGM